MRIYLYMYNFPKASGPSESELNFKLSRFAMNLPLVCYLARVAIESTGYKLQRSNYRTQLSVTVLNMIKVGFDFQRAYTSRLYICGPVSLVSGSMIGPLVFLPIQGSMLSSRNDYCCIYILIGPSSDLIICRWFLEASCQRNQETKFFFLFFFYTHAV